MEAAAGVDEWDPGGELPEDASVRAFDVATVYYIAVPAEVPAQLIFNILFLLLHRAARLVKQHIGNLVSLFDGSWLS